MKLTIPPLFISVPLHEAATGKEAQAIVDAPNSAVIMRWWGFPTIADHASHGGMFRLRYALPKLTQCRIDDDRYVCASKKRGVIRGNTIMVGAESVRDLTTDLCIYTCTGRHLNGETEVWVTFWNRK